MPVISLIKDNLQDFTSYIKGDQMTWYWSVDGVVEDKEGTLKQSLWRNIYKIYVFRNKYICEILCVWGEILLIELNGYLSTEVWVEHVEHLQNYILLHSKRG